MRGAEPASTGQPTLEVTDLTVHYELPRGWHRQPAGKVHAVDGISFALRAGSTFGIVGESGCGKSTTALAVMRLIKETAGSIRIDGTELTGMGAEELKRFRRKFQIIFQDPFSSLNPRQRAGDIIRAPLDIMHIGDPRSREERVAELLKLVGLRPEARALFPHQFSGGQRQRIGIARALATNPALIVCDEPVSALDVAIQAQILNLLKDLQNSLGVSLLIISHDMGVIRFMCHEIGVMYLGQFVETGDTAAIIRQPAHPYTWSLLNAVPRIDPEMRSLLSVPKLPGDPPSPIDPGPGCRFAKRCPYVEDRCRKIQPRLQPVRASASRHFVACHKVDERGYGPQHHPTL